MQRSLSPLAAAHALGLTDPSNIDRSARARSCPESIRAFAGHPAISIVLVVIHPDDRALYDAAVRHLPVMLPPAVGGATRQDSVRLGLEALAGPAPDLVLVHDAARPFVDAATIDRVLARSAEAIPPPSPPCHWPTP